MRVKMFWERTLMDLETLVNNFLSTLQPEQVRDIKYQVEDTSKYSAHFSCMIIYEKG
jgi:hypothetical protein